MSSSIRRKCLVTYSGQPVLSYHLVGVEFGEKSTGDAAKVAGPETQRVWVPTNMKSVQFPLGQKWNNPHWMRNCAARIEILSFSCGSEVGAWSATNIRQEIKNFCFGKSVNPNPAGVIFGRPHFLNHTGAGGTTDIFTVYQLKFWVLSHFIAGSLESANSSILF